MDTFYSIEQICAALDVKPDTVRGWIKDGAGCHRIKLPAVKLGKAWRVRAGDFDQFIQAYRLATEEQLLKTARAPERPAAKPKSTSSQAVKPPPSSHGDIQLEYTASGELARHVVKALFDRGMKHCSLCKDVKPLDDFPVDRANKATGRKANCKICEQERKRKRYSK